ncbi:MAG: hypothetical protein ACRCYC_07295 [Paraclostridium sp.]|uniref:hypothetical protein n=1 Tax=Paraclostridium sp. TaxID=2023273 RepID=UPI003F3E2F33
MLDRLFGNDGCFDGGGCGWIIIVLFFLFLAFGDCWAELDICAWIPFLILLLIIICCEGGFE